MIWTPELHDRIRELWASGLRPREIGPIIGVGYDATRAKCVRLGLVVTTRRPLNREKKEALPILSCLRCRKPFQSVDRRYNRICVECKQHGSFSYHQSDYGVCL